MLNRPESLPQHWVNRLSFALRRELVQRFRSAGIDATAEEWGAVLILGAGPLTAGQLSARTLRDRTTVTRLVDRLAARGWVLREADPKDRRRQVLRLTREGYEAHSDMAQVAAGVVTDSNRGIPPEDIARTVNTLRRMLRNLTGET